MNPLDLIWWACAALIAAIPFSLALAIVAMVLIELRKRWSK